MLSGDGAVFCLIIKRVIFKNNMSQEEVQGSVETVPKDLRQLRACLVCSLIKTYEQVGKL